MVYSVQGGLVEKRPKKLDFNLSVDNSCPSKVLLSSPSKFATTNMLDNFWCVLTMNYQLSL